MNSLRNISSLLISQARTYTVPLLVFRRNARSIIRTPRSELPKYKRDLKDLQPLTGLLTSPEVENIGIEDALQLRRDKVQLYKMYMPVGSNSTLLEALFHEDNDIDKLLRVIDDNLDTMNSFYVGISFETLDDMMRVGLCDKSTVAVSPEFKRLCTRALYKMRFFESDEVMKLLKCLATLQVPEGTLIVQAALQMTRHYISEYNPQELECLQRTLKSFTTTQETKKSLLLAIREAIPQAMELKSRQLPRIENKNSVETPLVDKIPD